MANHSHSSSSDDDDEARADRATAVRPSPRIPLECASCRDDVTDSDRVTFADCGHHVCPECACVKVLSAFVPLCPFAKCCRPVGAFEFCSVAKSRTRQGRVTSDPPPAPVAWEAEEEKASGAQEDASEAEEGSDVDVGSSGEMADSDSESARLRPDRVEAPSGEEIKEANGESAHGVAEEEANGESTHGMKEQEANDESPNSLEVEEANDKSTPRLVVAEADKPRIAATIQAVAPALPPDRSGREEMFLARCTHLREWLNSPESNGLLPTRSTSRCDPSLRMWVGRMKYEYANFVEGVKYGRKSQLLSREMVKERKEVLDELGFEEWWEYCKLTGSQAFVTRAKAATGEKSADEAMGTLVPAKTHNTNHRDEVWETRFQELKQHKALYGRPHVTCSEKKKNPELAGLYHWCITQRKGYSLLCRQARTGKHEKNIFLTKSRVDRLNEIGFQWALVEDKDAAWEKRFEQIVEYKRVHRNCRVPYKYKDCPGLGYWVDGIRKQYRSTNKNKKRPSTLTDERIARLESIGFIWQTKVRTCFRKSDKA